MLAITVVLLHTRLPMTESDRLTVSTILGVIILFSLNGIIAPISLMLPPSGFQLLKFNIKIYR